MCNVGENEAQGAGEQLVIQFIIGCDVSCKKHEFTCVVYS